MLLDTAPSLRVASRGRSARDFDVAPVELPRFRGQVANEVMTFAAWVVSDSMGDREPIAEWRREGLQKSLLVRRDRGPSGAAEA